MNKKERVIFNLRRATVIKELNKIESKYGVWIFKAAVNRKMKVDSQKMVREQQIYKLTNELNQLKSGKPIQ